MFISRRATLVTEATPDYVSGDLCGGKLSFQQRGPGCAGSLRRLTLKSIDAVGVATRMLLFYSDPSNTTFTENGAFSLHANDRTKLLDQIDIASGDWVNTTGTGLYVASKALADIPFALEDSQNRNIYAAFIALGTLNLSSVSSIEAILGSEVD